jgi:hypothetical protein
LTVGPVRDGTLELDRHACLSSVEREPGSRAEGPKPESDLPLVGLGLVRRQPVRSTTGIELAVAAVHAAGRFAPAEAACY